MSLFNRGRVVVGNTVVPHEPSGAEAEWQAQRAKVLRLVQRTFLDETRLEENDRDERLMDLCCDVKNLLFPAPVISGRKP